MATNFEASATYTATVITVSVSANGTATINIKNTDGDGREISNVTISAPADDTANATHSVTGDTGVTVPTDLVVAALALVSESSDLLAAVVANDKHSL